MIEGQCITAVIAHHGMGAKIKLTKLSAVPNPVAPTPSVENYTPGLIHEGVSLPNEYWIIGTLLRAIQVGEAIEVDRTNRNGIEVHGYFQSTPVTEIKDNLIRTRNSEYLIEYL
jgi:hypothetical protein